MENSWFCVIGMKEREKRVRFRKCGNAWPEVDFYGANAEFCDGGGHRCVMCIYVFHSHMSDT